MMFCNFRSRTRFDMDVEPRRKKYNLSKALFNFGKTVFEFLPVHNQIVALIMIF